MYGFFVRGYYEAKAHGYKSDDEWTEEHEFDFAGGPFSSILEPDELIDILGAYAVISPDLRDQLIADRNAGYCR